VNSESGTLSESSARPHEPGLLDADLPARRRSGWSPHHRELEWLRDRRPAHVQHLEARLIALATVAKRSALDNGNTPQPPPLSESDAADAEGFLAEMLLCFPVLGLNVFSAAVEALTTKKVDLQTRAKGVEAHGAETAQGFLVRAGSTAVQNEVPSIHAYLSAIRRGLVENGVLRLEADHYVFTQDYSFPSPSTAAGVVLGRAANGRTEWQTQDGRTLKAIQETAAAG
jgi:hypothetical protein